MRVLTYGDIMDSGTSVFTAIVQLDETRLILNFKGIIRIDNPYNHLSYFIDDLEEKIKESGATVAEINFTDLEFCNSNGFYVLMDIVDIIYKNVSGQIDVKRIYNDDWQKHTLPILLNTNDQAIRERTNFINH